jgi:uncharacterized protein (DUF885 family)
MYWCRKTARWAIILTVLMGGLTTPFTVHAATADEQFAKLRDQYFLRTLQLNPVTSSYLGGDGYSKKLKDINSKLRNYGADALANEDEFYRTLQAQLQKIDASQLSRSVYVDYDVLTVQLAFLVHQYEVVRNHQRGFDGG